MKTVFHPNKERGHANHGWLDTRHSFSFAGFYDPERTNFGALRVLNDDVVSGGGGFGTHPHENMEIISIPLSGSLRHKDSMGNVHVIKENDVQVMSAGTGVAHSEYNESFDDPVNFLQIWIFPDQKGVEPRYAQEYYQPSGRKGKFQLMLSPKDKGGQIWAHQNSWISRGEFEEGDSAEIGVNSKGNGLYILLLSGAVRIADQKLENKDALGIWETEKVTIEVLENSDILTIEVPMEESNWI